MKNSPEINLIAEALNKIQARIDDVQKNATNPHLKNNYANLSAVLDTVRPMLSAVGLSVIQLPGYGDGVVYVETVLMHVSGQFISSTSASPLPKADPQGVGSCITYLRRYSLAALVGITQADDDANSVKAASVEQLCTFAQADRMQRLLDRCPESTQAWFTERFGSTQSVPKVEFDRLYAGIKAKLDETQGEQA